MLGPIDGFLRDISHHSFYAEDPSVLAVTRAAATALGFSALTTFFVAFSGTVSFLVPALLVVSFTQVGLIHVIQLKEYRKLYR